MTLTIDAVLSLAPDEASAKAARGLISPAKWPVLGANKAAAWGECQGSGSKPYQTQVDLGGPAFRCSCPSRKFPCKHGLALLMMLAQDAERFTASAQPPWVAEWLASRQEKSLRKEALQEKKEAAIADPVAAEKREAQRWQRIQSAAGELQRWLSDQVARGLGTLGDGDRQAWRTMAARMVDAQAPGLGQRLIEAADGLHQGSDWPEHTLHRLGWLQLACEAMLRRPALDPALQADLRAAVGWPFDQAEVLSRGERISDRWCVLGTATQARENRLTERRVWLHGEGTGRRAWLLDHAFAGHGFEHSWLSGTSVEATLAYYPGAGGLRALPAGAPALRGTRRAPACAWDTEWTQIAQRVAASPWTSLHPLVVTDAVVVRAGAGLRLVAQQRALALLLDDADTWTLLACTGGHPVQLMGEWDGFAMRPLTAWTGRDEGPAWQRSVA